MDDNAAGAPEPLPLEEIPEVTLPEPVLPPRSRAVARGVKRTALGPVKGARGDALRCAAGNTRDIVGSRPRTAEPRTATSALAYQRVHPDPPSLSHSGEAASSSQRAPIAKAKVALAPGHYRLSATQQEDAIRKRQAAEQRESGQYRRLATDRKHMKKKPSSLGKAQCVSALPSSDNANWGQHASSCTLDMYI